MARLLWLADVARRAGLNVVEVGGWQTRGAATMVAKPSTVVAHHTATSARAQGDYPSLRIVRDGRPNLSGPLSQLGLGRSGTVYVIASGKANHAGRGSWRTCNSSNDAIGIEAEHPGDSTPWPEVQLDAYLRLCAAILRHTGRDHHWLCAHREWATPPGRKIDPAGIDMNDFRRRVSLLLSHAEPEPTPSTFVVEGLLAELPVLAAPSTHGNVRTMQALLNAGASVGLCPVIEIDGDFGPRTRTALLVYQQRMGLPVDGVCGPQTWRALLALPQ